MSLFREPHKRWWFSFKCPFKTIPKRVPMQPSKKDTPIYVVPQRKTPACMLSQHMPLKQALKISDFPLSSIVLSIRKKKGGTIKQKLKWYPQQRPSPPNLPAPDSRKAHGFPNIPIAKSPRLRLHLLRQLDGRNPRRLLSKMEATGGASLRKGVQKNASCKQVCKCTYVCIDILDAPKRYQYMYLRCSYLNG